MNEKMVVSKLIKSEPLHLKVAQLIKELRHYKNVTQEEVCQHAKITRQYLSEIENGHRKQLNLVKIQEIVQGCGERLYVTTSYDNPLQISDQTEKEDKVLNSFAEGQIQEAERLLSEIRQWRYPTEHIMAKCKRKTAVALSYHFRQMPRESEAALNRLVMGLAMIDCREEADYFMEMYYRIMKLGEKEVMKRRRVLRKEQKGALS
ncbi:helix-turn-helix transcriptional regulator [Vagococcus sp. BWB3-3]|uniref:Helix-turn-helix transcriptional regulator n=1 Tax=Vagococcus allomyrinae TaxID=2794353 RepID=A0A940SUI3_9ENTE|nr:helix-turn-helix transcriptional regulator [Vagococcus allomyrinae]MBP1040091.1 helix-turn-helix transcriptional regulator [Vagococcus allomyrinae]